MVPGWPRWARGGDDARAGAPTTSPQAFPPGPGRAGRGDGLACAGRLLRRRGQVGVRALLPGRDGPARDRPPTRHRTPRRNRATRANRTAGRHRTPRRADAPAEPAHPAELNGRAELNGLWDRPIGRDWPARRRRATRRRRGGGSRPAAPGDPFRRGRTGRSVRSGRAGGPGLGVVLGVRVRATAAPAEQAPPPAAPVACIGAVRPGGVVRARDQEVAAAAELPPRWPCGGTRDHPAFHDPACGASRPYGQHAVRGARRPALAWRSRHPGQHRARPRPPGQPENHGRDRSHVLGWARPGARRPARHQGQARPDPDGCHRARARDPVQAVPGRAQSQRVPARRARAPGPGRNGPNPARALPGSHGGLPRVIRRLRPRPASPGAADES